MRNKTVTEIKPAYTYYLERNLRKINQAASTGNKEQLVAVINEVVKPAASTFVNKYGTKLPTKKVKFLKTIASPRMTIDNVMDYCFNSINRANQTIAKYDNLPTE